MQRRTGRGYGRRFNGGGVGRPTRVWAGISAEFLLNSITATGSATLIQLQAPAALSNLTSDPPEDMTILRLRGTFAVTVSGSAGANWTLALIVQDTTWTPGTFLADSDKRLLWTRTFEATNATADEWAQPGYHLVGGTAFPCHPDIITLDISPKVRIECGKALFLVGYENAGAGTLLVTSPDMRVLFQRTQRRR